MRVISKTEEIAWDAAVVIGDLLNRFLDGKDQVVLGVVGGQSITPVLPHLITLNVPWHRVQVFLVDERVVPVDDPLSNMQLLYDLLSSKIPFENLHPFLLKDKNPEFCIRRYQQTLQQYGDRFDVLVLSAGVDGHIASLFPNHPALADDSDWFILVDHAPKAPSLRMSAGRRLLLRSGAGVLLFFGEQKRNAYERFVSKEYDISSCPAKLLQRLSELFVMTNISLDEEVKLV